MAQKDYWGDTLRNREKAEEDRYFAEQDRALIEKLHRQHRQPQKANPNESTVTDDQNRKNKVENAG